MDMKNTHEMINSQDIAGVQTIAISKHYGAVKAVDDISMTVENGQYYVLLGPSGGGKTTLLRLIGGFVKPTAGQILLHGQDVSNLPPNKRATSMVFQSYALFPHMSVERNVSYGLKLKKVSPVDIARKVNDMLDLVGLAGYGGRMPHELSGGQQQRVQLARSLVLESDVILLDEPLAALDANLRKDMCFELKRIQEQVGITFIHVTHNQEEALTIADRIAIVADGKLAEEGTPKEIYERPVKKFTAEFIGENNLLEGKVSEINGEQATIDLGYAQITIIRPNNTAVAGTKIALSIPSEIVDISDGKPTETGNIQFLEAVFISNSYAGYSSFNLVRLADGTEMASRAPVKGERQQMKPGQTVCVSWPTEAGRLHVT